MGGGPSGVYMAMQLGRVHRGNVCLFEKEDKLGGRINDVAVNPGFSNSPMAAIGGRRVTDRQNVMHDLAMKLDIELQNPQHQDATFLFARGIYSFNKDDFYPHYPGLQGHTKIACYMHSVKGSIHCDYQHLLAVVA